MGFEQHPDPEGAVVRLGAPVLATVLLAGAVVLMFAMPAGSLRTTFLVVIIGVQVALMLVRGWMVRRAARPVDRPLRWHQFAFMWGAPAAVDAVLHGQRSTAAALVGLGEQLLIAIFVVVMLWLNEEATPPEWWPRRWWPRRGRTVPDVDDRATPRMVPLVERTREGTEPPGPSIR